MISNYDHFYGDEHDLDNDYDERYYRLADELYEQWREEESA
jgi:hypothetical protein